jgi:hypothetical protein
MDEQARTTNSFLLPIGIDQRFSVETLDILKPIMIEFSISEESPKVDLSPDRSVE